MGRGHAMALLIEQAPGQESWQAADPAASLDGVRGKPGLDGGEQCGIENGLVVAPERLAAIHHLADIEPVAQQMREAADPEGNAPNDAAVLQLALLGADAAALKVLGQRPHRAKLQVTGEYGRYDLGLRRHDDGRLVHGRITERDRSADPGSLCASMPRSCRAPVRRSPRARTG